MNTLKTLVRWLPRGIQYEIRRLHWLRKIKMGSFTGDEPEFWRLGNLLRPGDVVIDVGANVGQYTRRMSRLVGPTGRVFAFEPMADTFRLLASNSFDLSNVTLLNLAASDSGQEVSMHLPQTSGVDNYYRAAIAANGMHRVTALRLDSLPLTRLDGLKLDAEGHEPAVLAGAQSLLEQFRPWLIVEAGENSDAQRWLLGHNYQTLRLPNSPNLIAYHVSRVLPDLTQVDDGTWEDIEARAF